MNLDIGHVIDGKYRVTRLLGTGGMGAVYEGENTRIRRRVAIKMLHGEVSSQAETVTRFEREAQAAGRIGSEHICEVLDLGVLADGTRYMVMEYLEGETLSARIKKTGRLPPLQCIPLVAQVLEALSAAHAAGIIHRDLKPDNLWIVPHRGGMADFVKVLDFGVSKFTQGGDEMNMTRAGAVVGTPYYMSPEQARGMSAIDARTDIYAIGVLMFQAVTGQVPFQADTFNELLFKIVLEHPPTPQSIVPDLDPEFAAIIQKAMSREPVERFQSCAELRAALLAYAAARTDRPTGGQHAPRAPAGGAAPAPWAAGSAPGAAPAPWAADSTPGVATAAWNASSPVIPPGWTPPAAAPGWKGAPAAQAGPGPAAPPGQTAPNGAHATSAAPWGAGAPAQQPTATGAAWGNASGTGATPARPRSSAPLVLAFLALFVTAAGGLGAYLFFGRHPHAAPVAPAAPDSSAASASSTPAPPPSAASPPSASAAPAAPVTAPPVTASAVAPPATATPATKGNKPPPPPKNPHPKGGTSPSTDLGY